MKFNYLIVIWIVKIFLAKIKESKGRDLKFSAKKKLPTKTPPKILLKIGFTSFFINYFRSCLNFIELHTDDTDLTDEHGFFILLRRINSCLNDLIGQVCLSG